MGCINDKAQSPQLPHNTLQKTQPQPQNQQRQQYPAAIAFQIPANSNKSKPTKGSQLNKQLYIIGQVSNANNELVQSPLRLPKETHTFSNNKQVVDGYQPSVVKQKNRTKTCKDISVCSQSDNNDQERSNPRTSRQIPTHPILPKHLNIIQKRNQIRQIKNAKRESDNNSSLSKRYMQDQSHQLGVSKRKRRASLDQNNFSQHSVHFKRAKTLHHQDQLVFQSKSISMNRGETDAMSSLPVKLQAPLLGNRNYQGEINLMIQNQGEDSPHLLQLYHNLSAQLQTRQQFEGAITANTKYLKLARKIYGVDSCSYASGLSNLSSINYSMANCEKAVENSMKAKSIRSYSPLEDYMHKARVLNEIGLIELEQNHIKEASHYLEEVKEIHNKVANQLHVNFQDLLSEVLKIPNKNQYYKKCVQSMELALRICIFAFGENHLQTANHLDDLATSYCDSGQYQQCLSCYQRCFNIMRVMRLLKHKDFQVHYKHFDYNLQIIKMSYSATSQAISKAIDILQAFFPQHALIIEFKSRLRKQQK